MRITSILLFAILIILQSCDGTTCARFDQSIGFTGAGKELCNKEVYMTVNGRSTKRHEFYFQENIRVSFTSFKGFVAKNGMIFPSCELITLSENEDTILHLKNTMVSRNGWPKDSSLTIYQRFPAQHLGNCKTIIIIRDDHSTGTYIATFKYLVKPLPGIEVKTNNASCSGAAITDDSLGYVKVDNVVFFNERLNLRLFDIKGFKIEGERFFPIATLDMRDATGKFIVEDINLLENYKDRGIPVSALSELTMYFLINKVQVKNPITYTCKILDQKSDAVINVKGQFSIW